MTGLIFYKANGAYLRVLDVTNASTDELISDATVTATLYRWSAGGGLGSQAVASEISSLALLPLPETPGGYEGTIVSAFDVSAGTGYRCVIDIAATGIEDAHYEIPVEVKVRQQ